MKTKDLFCSNCQEVTLHNAEVDSNSEYVFTCEVCGRFLKLPADVDSKEKADELFAKHEESNVGQISIEAQEKKLGELLEEQEAPAEEIVEE